jgi:hypothetical protein
MSPPCPPWLAAVLSVVLLVAAPAAAVERVVLAEEFGSTW